MHMALVEEQLNGHDLSHTILFPSITGVTQARFISLLKHDLVVFPDLNFTPSASDNKTARNYQRVFIFYN